MEHLRRAKLKLAEIAVDPNNPRTHGERNIAALEKSLAKFGQVEPLLVRAADKSLVAGHGRLEAMRNLGWTHAECAMLDVSAKRARAIGVALNRTAELAGWAWDPLAALLSDLDRGVELGDLGFEQAELNAMLLKPAEGLPSDDDGRGREKTAHVVLKLQVERGREDEVLDCVRGALEAAGLDTVARLR